MAKPDLTVQIPSLTEGKTWMLTVYRGNRGITASATEGVASVTPTGLRSFAFNLTEARRCNIILPASRLTAKVEAEGLRTLQAKMVAEGLIAADAEATPA